MGLKIFVPRPSLPRFEWFSVLVSSASSAVATTAVAKIPARFAIGVSTEAATTAF
jgi:hypothetical protein